ncbi:siderophore-interacting protein [Ketobacter sp.]|uniref:siderophore-interacting protein n=1 Tax=Ketobacter sp. TaxID=2083498 RepID=UPI000F1EC23D|nr:siderophore-interacting protein [Ketobacter sp.]RLT96834.1 MAG: siderophore-interacting protein [Ketobacter sp.]
MSNTTPRRTPPRLLRVKHTRLLSPGLKRVTLAGDALAGFPSDSDGAHIKLMFPQPHQTDPVLPTLGPSGPVWPPDHERPIVRTYSVSRYHADAGELEVDFVLHGDNGPGSSWAQRAQPGDAIGVAGPGGPDRVKPAADWYLLVADPSAYAALAAALSALPDNARGYALMEVASADEIVPLQAPPGVTVHWLMRGSKLPGVSTLLLDKVVSLPWLPGTPSVMVAGENSQVVAIRDYVLQEKQLPKKMLYAVPYWKDQHDEESYHAERHRIMDELDEQ